jgi:hypothetical protein
MENKIKVFNRCDLIVSPVYEYFAELYPQFTSKYRFMPKFFSPNERYVGLPFNERPKMRCLLSGATKARIYPLRNFIKRRGQKIDHRPAKYVGNAYAELLHSYFCCVTSSSIFKYVVAKYCEIPATGSLLIADETEDLKRMGFVPHKHYIPITRKNALTQIADCLNNPEEYNHIRKEGMLFVRKNHSINNRIIDIKKWLVELVG